MILMMILMMRMIDQAELEVEDQEEQQSRKPEPSPRRGMYSCLLLLLLAIMEGHPLLLANSSTTCPDPSTNLLVILRTLHTYLHT